MCCELSELQLSTQPRDEVSPPKWHLGHTTWFYETVILKAFVAEYKVFDENFIFIFNSYYKKMGEHCLQSDRGKINVDSDLVLAYRKYVDEHILELLNGDITEELKSLVTVGLQHEEQHQELLHMDIKAILFEFDKAYNLTLEKIDLNEDWYPVNEGLVKCGSIGNGFSYDNELPRHKFYQYSALVKNNLVTNAEYKSFVDDGGYNKPEYWLSKGWDWIVLNSITAPLYWDDTVAPLNPVAHISYYEADAYANWSGCRLPTEYEHELFDEENRKIKQLWSWTSSPYIGYPGYQKFDGALSEYNGKFMCNQFVLRGGCIATPDNHWRTSYRNFYEPHQRWMFSGIRLAKDRV
jgi:ergothioneine biosynthesis protein EgtB